MGLLSYLKVGAGEQKKPIEYICPEIEPKSIEEGKHVHMMVRITPVGDIERLTCFEPAIDNEAGREKFLDRFQTPWLFGQLSEKAQKSSLPPELGNDQMAEYFYQVRRSDESAGDQTPRLIGERSSGTLQAYISSPHIERAEKLEAALGVIRGLRFLHARLYCNPSLGFNDIEVVNGKGKLARGWFVSKRMVRKQDFTGESRGLSWCRRVSS